MKPLCKKKWYPLNYLQYSILSKLAGFKKNIDGPRTESQNPSFTLTTSTFFGCRSSRKSVIILIKPDKKNYVVIACLYQYTFYIILFTRGFVKITKSYFHLFQLNRCSIFLQVLFVLAFNLDNVPK